jgi:hypothetical protein
LDGGNVYTQRRQAQLAADAGALAGARAHCDPNVDETPADAANTYVTNNNATMTSFSLNEDLHEVTVGTSITFDTFFLGILGRSQLAAEAIAAAKCETGSGAAVLPVAWSCRPPDIGEEPGPGCDLKMDNNNDNCTYPSDPDPLEPRDVFYMIIDSSDLDDVIYCAEDGTGYGSDDGGWAGFDCDYCDPDHVNYPAEGTDQRAYCDSDYPKCDLDCNGEVDLQILSEGSFGWLDLDGGSSDANELRDWVLGDDVPYVWTHHWYAGKTGMATTVFHAVGEHVTGKSAVVPVFDTFCSKVFGVPGPGNDDCEWHTDIPEHDPDEDVVIDSSIADDYFHIGGFANFLVTCVNANPYPKHVPSCEFHDILVDKGFMKKTAKSIEGCFIEGVDPDITGYGSIDFNAYTLRLSK